VGAKKIRSMLAREGYPVPAVSTVHQVLVRRGLASPVVAGLPKLPYLGNQH
jgi:hypothetical protein